MIFKTLTFFAWAIVSYIGLVFWATSWWMAAPFIVSFALSMAGIGFSVQHDGGHGAYSENPWVSKAAAAVLDVIGASSFVWHHKHNILHHTHTNVEGVDDDLNAQPFLRMMPAQPRHWFHRFQHIYSLPLIGLFFTTKWALFDDFRVWATGKIGPQTVPRPKPRQAALLVVGKILYVIWALIIPLSRHDFSTFLIGYFSVAFVQGMVLGLVFQLAHAVDDTEIFARPPAGQTLPRSFYEHQIATTVDFAPNNPFVTWYVGGLNFQVVHHLFPKVCHLHYPALAKLVAKYCAEHGIAYHCHPTLRSAFAAHIRFMRAMGRGEEAPAVVVGQATLQPQ